MERTLIEIAQEIGETLQPRRLLLTTAESCTGGWVGQAITAIPGSSDWFERGFITYSDTAKQEMLGVSEQTLRQYGAVSEETALEMAEGALRFSHAHLSLSVTGIAGPTGATHDKPIGLVWIAWSSLQLPPKAKKAHFSGDRDQIRHQAVALAMTGLLEYMGKLPIK